MSNYWANLDWGGVVLSFWLTKQDWEFEPKSRATVIKMFYLMLSSCDMTGYCKNDVNSQKDKPQHSNFSGFLL